MNGLELGQLVSTINRDGVKDLRITHFKKDDNECIWASLGELKYLEGYGYYGEREWLIATSNDEFLWQKSKWKLI